YRAGDYLDGSVKYDVIIDTGGRNPVRKLRRALHKKGTLVIVGGEGGGKVTGGIGRQLRAALLSPFVSQRLGFFISEEHHRHIDRLAHHLAGEGVVAPIGRSYRLDSVPDAIADLVAGNAAGKSVIVLDRDDG
ncbi:MAG: zinc-binding dehydrogenase, partial [Acidimicrobiia bacterium]|nr:zinc-binding dehydrogenase [Acidimicrobiia bacterium]